MLCMLRSLPSSWTIFASNACSVVCRRRGPSLHVLHDLYRRIVGVDRVRKSVLLYLNVVPDSRAKDSNVSVYRHLGAPIAERRNIIVLCHRGRRVPQKNRSFTSSRTLRNMCLSSRTDTRCEEGIV